MKDCKIAQMLQAQKKHLSFHTPGHKRAGADITELSYSDNLLSPTGVIKEAQEDAAKLLGAERTFFLTDGSSAGVHAMLFALKARGVKKIAYSAFSHVSVKNGCQMLGLQGEEIPPRTERGIPCQPTVQEIERALDGADALLLTSPDYYGNFPPLKEAKALCEKAGKPLLIDGAHGSHLHFEECYAGNFADLWVDGLHKSLPALTQGAAVSAKSAVWAEALQEGVSLFRTTSPSYPILASVEYAIKYPRNEKIERAAEEFKKQHGAYPNADWSKVLIPFGEYAFEAQRFLEAHGVYPEFNDGNYLMFYLSPCTNQSALKKLGKLLQGLPRAEVKDGREELFSAGETAAWVPLSSSIGRVCARECGIFPPCVPVIFQGERVSGQAVKKLACAKNTFGLQDKHILVYGEKE